MSEKPYRIAYQKLETLSKADLDRMYNRGEIDLKPFIDKVRPIVDAVRERGDEAIREVTRKIDGIELGDLRVSDKERNDAESLLDPEVKKAIETAAGNIRKFHESLMPEPLKFIEIRPGILAGEKTVPIPSVGLYVPRGKGSFPSVVLMTAVPAQVARVPEVRMVTPPEPDGSVDAAVLVAANHCGVKEIYKVGGAQAVAALALGTESIAPVSKILGPGGPYVMAAKRLLEDAVDTGLPAGPSEAIVLADKTADPVMAARDLLIEAEHGADSWAYLVTDSEATAKGVVEALPGLLDALPQWRRDFAHEVLDKQGGVILAGSMEAAVGFVNDFAPEHLAVLTEDPLHTLDGIRNAGEVMLGAHTPMSLANYALGPNAVLPTGGRAKTYSALSPADYIKRIGLGWVSKKGFDALADTVVTLAEREGFPAHAAAVTARKKAS